MACSGASKASPPYCFAKASAASGLREYTEAIRCLPEAVISAATCFARVPVPIKHQLKTGLLILFPPIQSALQ